MQINHVKGGLRLKFNLKNRPKLYQYVPELQKDNRKAYDTFLAELLEWVEGFEKELRYRLNVASQNPEIEIRGLPNQKIAHEIEKTIRQITIQVHEIVIKEILGDEA